MQDITKLIDSVFAKGVDYSRTAIELAKLKAVDKVSDISSTFILRLVFILLFAFVLLFINLGLAFWLSEILGRIYFGFLVIGGFYLLLGILMRLLLNDKLKRSIRNYVIKHLLK